MINIQQKFGTTEPKDTELKTKIERMEKMIVELYSNAQKKTDSIDGFFKKILFSKQQFSSYLIAGCFVYFSKPE